MCASPGEPGVGPAWLDLRYGYPVLGPFMTRGSIAVAGGPNGCANANNGLPNPAAVCAATGQPRAL